ncbi:MAG: thermonuclease family protein [Salinibacterium sp.]|nr:thermonuclease family protein [Salinibacterium sp.]
MHYRRRPPRTGGSIDGRYIVLVVVIVAAAGYFLATAHGQQSASQLGFSPIMQPLIGAPASNSDPEVEAAPGNAPLGETVDGGIPNQATEATVDYVHDGDTLFLGDGRKVRMLGIDTPEIGENLECYGDEATELLRLLLPEGSHVWVLPDVEPFDQYGRSLLFIYRDDTTNVNLEMLAQGAAEVEMYSPNLLFQNEIEAAESAAIASGAGMWGAC